MPLAILLAVAFLTYANALRDGFVADDRLQILLNPYVTTGRDVAKLFTTDVWGFASPTPGNYYRPLQMLVYVGEFAVFGSRPWPWHLFNLFMNLAGITAAYFLAKVLADRSTAFWTGLFFALHPMHVEPVVWVAALPDLLCGLLLFLALLAYHAAHLKQGMSATLYYALAVAAFAAATMTKETALLFPALIVSYEFFYRKIPFRKLWQCLPRLLPYAAVLFGYVLMRLNALGSFTPNTHYYVLLSPGQLAFAIPVLIARYLGKLLLPLHFNYFYISPPVTKLNFVSAAAILLTAALVVSMFLLRKRQPLLAFALAWFFLILGPAFGHQCDRAELLHGEISLHSLVRNLDPGGMGLAMAPATGRPWHGPVGCLWWADASPGFLCHSN